MKIKISDALRVNDSLRLIRNLANEICHSGIYNERFNC